MRYRIVLKASKVKDEETLVGALGNALPEQEVVARARLPEAKNEKPLVIVETWKNEPVTLEVETDAHEAVLKLREKKNVTSVVPVLTREYALLDCSKKPETLTTSSCPSQLPGTVKGTATMDAVAITDEMVQDYRDDVKLAGTYANEAEAALMAALLGISFTICTTLLETTDLVPVLEVGPPPPTHYLLHRYNHYVVLTADNDGGYELKRTALPSLKFRESQTKTRADGSCLLDACHIVRRGAKATDEEILEYRGWLSQALTDDAIRQTLTTIIIDELRGYYVPGLGPKTRAYCDTALPKKPKGMHLIEGTPHPLVLATASHALMTAMNEHEGPLVLQRDIVQKAKKGKQTKGEPLALAANVTEDDIMQALGPHDDFVLVVNSGTIDAVGSYVLICECQCQQQCLWATLELRVLPTGIEPEQSGPIDILLGAEFTFTSKAMQESAEDVDVVASDANSAAQKRWVKEATSARKAGTFFQEQVGAVEVIELGEGEDASTSYRFVYKDHWWYQVSLDVQCLELQTAPITLARAIATRERLQHDIFAFAQQKLKIEPHALVGGGHIHIGVAHTFRDDALLFRNFFVDLCNHPLMMEAWDNDPVNAPVLAQHDAGPRDALTRVLREFDRMLEDNTPGEKLILAFAAMVRERVYTFAYSPRESPTKLQAINVNRITPDHLLSERTIEIRSIRAQRNIDEFILFGTLMQARIKWLLETQKKPLSYLAPTRPLAHSDQQAIRDELTTYVTQCGLDPRPFVNLLQHNYEDRDPETFSDMVVGQSL